MKQQPLRILFVEDVAEDVEVAAHELRKAGIDFVSRRVDTEEGLVEALAEFEPDLILSDYSMPALDALAALEVARRHAPASPFIVVTGSINEETAVACIKAGADDYVLKDHLGRLAPAVLAALDNARARRERTLAVEALSRSEANYRHLFESANDAILVLEPSSQAILDANPRAAEMYGIAAGELVGMKLVALSGDAAGTEEQIRQLLTSGGSRRYETVHRRPDGGRLHLEVSASIVEYQGRPAVLKVERDVTARQRAEVELRRLAAAVEQAAESIVVTDADATILYVNPGFERITGYSRADAIGQKPSLLKSGLHQDAFYASLWHTLVKGATWHGHFMNRHKDGHVFQEEATISTIFDRDGRIEGYVAVNRDVTQERALETQLRQSQKIEAVGKLASGVAHDFNNVLQALLSQMESLGAASRGDARLEGVVAECEATIRRGAALTRQLLLFSRRETMQTVRVDLNEVLREGAVLMRRLLRATVALDLDLAPGQVWVEGDRGQLDQVVMNLAVNASDAMPDGGTLTLGTGREPGGWVRLAVRDTGTGMPAEVAERIFEPFFTTKGAGKGTGLGLAVVHGIVTHHGGHIEVSSAPDEGTAFRISLPAAAGGELPALPEQLPEPAEPAAGGRGERVLVVEDEEGARNGLSELLSMLGYAVTAVGSGEEAGVLPESPAYDLLLSDLVLPGAGGGEVAEGLSARWPGLKVILMSGYTEDEATRHRVATTTVHFLQKPFGLDELSRKVRTALDEA